MQNTHYILSSHLLVRLYFLVNACQAAFIAQLITQAYNNSCLAGQHQTGCRKKSSAIGVPDGLKVPEVRRLLFAGGF
jgi:hypothetical protein